MKKIIILTVLLILSSVALAQQAPVKITGGSISVDGSISLAGNAVIETSEFTAAFEIGGSGFSHWETDCHQVGCGVGSSFRVPKMWAFANTVRRSVNFTTTEINYGNVFHQIDGVSINANTFFIPRMTRRKGGFVVRKPFQLQGRYLVCRTDPFTTGCPPEDVIFDKIIEGQGTLTIFGKMRSQQNEPGRRPRFYIESFEYTFEQ